MPEARRGPATTWRDLIGSAEKALGSRTDARRIVEQASGHEGAALLTRLDSAASVRQRDYVSTLVERRARGEPLQYVLGRWGFRRLELLVDRRVLIPRPETETLVEVVLGELRELGLGRPPLVVDLGTGSGAIALSLAMEVAGAQVWATDVSADALAVARANVAGLGSRGGTRVRLAQGSWFSALPAELEGRVDVLVSNPPYVAEAEAEGLPAEVADWEPRDALVAGPEGLEAVRLILAQAPRWLTRPGVLVLELAPHQAPAAVAEAGAGGFGTVEVHPDLQGRPRVLVARL